MSGARRRPTQQLFSLVDYAAADNLSYDSDSDNTSRHYAAYFSKKNDKPADSTTTLTQCHAQLILQFPDAAFEINALAYYYGLFLADTHIAYDPSFHRLFCFFAPDELQLSRSELIAFRDDLRKHRTIS